MPHARRKRRDNVIRVPPYDGALTIRKINKRAIGSQKYQGLVCMNGCVTAPIGSKQRAYAKRVASHVVYILDYPLGALCPHCARDWRRWWDENHSFEDEE